MKKSKLVIGLYVIAGLLGILTIYMVISSVSYLSSYAQSYGMGISDLGGEAYSYILTNSVNYLIYAILVFAAAKILEQVTAVREQLAGCCCTAEKSLIHGQMQKWQRRQLQPANVQKQAHLIRVKCRLFTPRTLLSDTSIKE